MVTDAPIARHVRVRYRPWARQELDETFVLAPDEQRVTTGVILVRGLGIAPPHEGLVVLTDRRLCLVVHYLFRPDRGFEFPRGCLVGVSQTGLPTSRFLRLHYRTRDGLAHLDLATDTARGALALRTEPITAGHLLEAVQRAWGTDAPALDAR